MRVNKTAYISMTCFIEQYQKNASEISFKSDCQTRFLPSFRSAFFYGLRRKAGITGWGPEIFVLKAGKPFILRTPPPLEE